MNKHEAVGRVVALLKGAGLPIYAYGSRREPIRWGVQVALGWRRRGTIDVQTQGDPDGAWFARAREVLRDAGWTEIYVNEHGHAVSVRVPMPARANPGSASLRSFLPPDVSLAAVLLPAARAPVPGRAAPARYLIRWIEGDPAVADLLAGRVVDTLVGLQRVLQALAGSAAGRATGRYLKVSLVPFHGEPPDPESSAGALRIDLQHEDADELDLADPNSRHRVPSTVQEQSQPATARDNELVAEVRRLQAEADEEAYDAFNEPPAPAPRRPVEPVPEWTSPSYGPVYVKLGDWTNLGAVVDGKRMRYGWNAAQGRWARGEVPPAALLNEALEHGWSFWLGEGAPKAEAPTHSASRDVPPPTQKAQPVEAPKAAATRPTASVFTDAEVPWADLRKGDILLRFGEGSTAWVGTIDPVMRTSGLGTVLNLGFQELLTSSALGQSNRVIGHAGKYVPANDFTFGNIVHRRQAFDPKKGQQYLPGWGSALIRYYLDQLGVAYDPHARFLREIPGAYGRPSHYYDITAPLSIVYTGGATPQKRGDAELRPEPGDVLIERDGPRFYVSLRGQLRSLTEEERAQLTPAQSATKDGERFWSPTGVSTAVSRAATVPAPDFTEGVIRAQGRALLNKYQGWMHTVAQRLLALGTDATIELAGMPHWRALDAEHRDMPEQLARIPAAIPAGARVLYRAGSTHNWEDVTEGTGARTRLDAVRLPKDHPLAALRRQEKPFDAAAYAGKLRDLAERMEDTIRDKLDPAIGHQNLTHRRAGIASSMRAEGVGLQRIQGMLNALADAAEAGTLPESLRGVTARTEVETLSYPWRRLVKDIEHNEEYRHPDKVKELQAILEHNLIGNYEGARLPGHWRNWKDERRSVLEKAPRKQASRVFLKWADDLHYDTSAVPPPAVADAIIELGTDVFSPMAVDLAKSARRAYRLGATDNRTWHQLLLDFRPIWEAGRKERRSAAEIQREKIREMERELIGTTIPGFFPTPRGTAIRTVQAARIKPGARVLEPSAGKGDMALAIRSLHPDAQIDVVEHAYTLRKFLELHGFNLVAHDFMEYNPGPVYDAVVMNPPFEDGQDAIHVMRAYTMLKPGGRLAAIMSSGPFFRAFKRDQAFRDWLEEVGGQVEDLPEGSFTGAESFRQTGVNTKLVVIERAR